MIDYRVKVDLELKKAIAGTWPPPHIVMDKLLQIQSPNEELKDFAANDDVLRGKLVKSKETKKQEKR